jgi:hypothetical protein
MTNDLAMCSFVTLDSAAGRASAAACVLLATLYIHLAADWMVSSAPWLHSDAPSPLSGTFLLQQDLTELLSGQLPDDAFHLQGKKGSQNVAGIQPGVFYDFVNMPWFLGAECVVNLLF